MGRCLPVLAPERTQGCFMELTTKGTAFVLQDILAGCFRLTGYYILSGGKKKIIISYFKAEPSLKVQKFDR